MDGLRKVFNRLNLILIGDAAMRFIDPVVFAICLPIWDTDEDGFISESEAEKTGKFNQGTFNGRSDITSLDDLEKLGGYIYHAGSFSDMPNLLTASIGNKLNLTTGIPDYFTLPYSNCPKLTRVKISPNITEISNNGFINDISLKEIIWGGNEVKLGNGCFSGCTSLEETALPTSVTSILDMAFYNCISLNSISLEHVKNIAAGGFRGCENLRIDVCAPELETLGRQAFSGAGIISASNLGSITSVDYFAFYCPNLKYVVLPDTITSIGSSVFYGSTKLEYIICHATIPPTLDSSAFNSTSCIIYVPDASVNAYKTATNWSRLASRIKPISEKV